MNDTGAVGRYLEPVTCHAAVCPNNEYWHSRRVLHFLFCLSHKKVLIPQQTGFFPEFRDDFPGIPGDLLLYTGASKISMDVAEPSRHNPRYGDDTPSFDPSCTLVAPHLRWDPYPLCTLGLFPPSTSRCAAPLAPYALDVVCGRLSPPTRVHQRFITAPSRSHTVYHPEFRDLLKKLRCAPQGFAPAVRCRQYHCRPCLGR